MPKKPVHVIEAGNRYGKLLVLSRGPNYTKRYRKWICRCDCGNESEYGHLILSPSPSMLARGFQPRTECNDCRTSVCKICGDAMPYKKCVVVCEKSECRDEDYERRTGTKLPDDPQERKRLRDSRAYRRTVSNRYNDRRRRGGINREG